MTDTTGITSGDPQDGISDTPVNPLTTSTDEKVAYKSYSKVLGEKKKLAGTVSELQAKIDKFETDAKEKADEELKVKEDYKTLLGLRDQELEDTKKENTSFRNQFDDSKKLRAVLRTIKGELPDRYYGLVDLDKVAIDPNTGEVDQMSVTKVVDDYTKTYPETLRAQGGPGLPNTAPAGSKTLTYDAWLKLPAKEMAARQSEVMEK